MEPDRSDLDQPDVAEWGGDQSQESVEPENKTTAAAEIGEALEQLNTESVPDLDLAAAEERGLAAGAAAQRALDKAQEKYVPVPTSEEKEENARKKGTIPQVPPTKTESLPAKAKRTLGPSIPPLSRPQRPSADDVKPAAVPTTTPPSTTSLGPTMASAAEGTQGAHTESTETAPGPLETDNEVLAAKSAELRVETVPEEAEKTTMSALGSPTPRAGVGEWTPAIPIRDTPPAQEDDSVTPSEGAEVFSRVSSVADDLRGDLRVLVQTLASTNERLGRVEEDSKAMRSLLDSLRVSNAQFMTQWSDRVRKVERTVPQAPPSQITASEASAMAPASLARAPSPPPQMNISDKDLDDLLAP